MSLPYFDQEAVDAALAYKPLVESLRAAFAGDFVMPVRHHHVIERKGGADAMNLLMPAWTTGGDPNFLGTKIVNVFPDNGKVGLPAIQGVYVVMSGDTGQPIAIMDGARLTVWRTACASALASSYLSRADASHLVMVGAGALAPFMIRAHAAVRPISRVTIWNHNLDRARDLADNLSEDAFAVRWTSDLAEAVKEADIVACATLSQKPIVKGEWLQPGAHLDLVGAYKPTMRESDDEAVKRARLFVDTKAGALIEGGDIAMPLATGIISADKIEADLFDLCKGAVEIERKPEDITLFKSTGAAIEDLAAAMLVWQRGRRG